MTREFTKTVETIAKNDDEQVAISAVLVPDEVDRQLDFLREEGVRNLYNPDADIGVMHAVFNNDAASSEHRILDGPETIGGEEYAAGTWIERREYQDDELWQLVEDGILEGRSIGGELDETREYAPGEVPDDVAFPANVPSDRGATEIVDGSVSEVSDVDVPAVPNAEHAVVKTDLGKDVLDEAATEAEFIQAMSQRGHSEDEARRLWDYMQSAGKSDATKQELDPDVHECKESVLEDNPDMSESEAIAICRDQLGMSADKLAAEDVDTTPPEDVQAAAQAALDVRDDPDVDVSDCGTQTGWTRANQLANGESVSEETINRMVSFLSRHLAQAPDDLSTLERDSCQRVMIQAWGGRPGLRWAESVQEQLENHETMTESDTTDDTDAPTDKQLEDIGDATLGQRLKSALGFGGGAADDGDVPEDSETSKVGRTLSQRNVALAKEMHDDAEEMLRDAGVDCHSATARTYHEDKHDDYERGAHGEYEDKAADADPTTKQEDPCWDGYTMVGLDGDGNPRCVPDEDVEDVDFEQAVTYDGQAEPPEKVDDSDAAEQKANDAGGNSGVDLGDLDPERVDKLADKINL